MHHIVTGAVDATAEKLGARLNEQNEQRLDLAKDTVQHLSVLNNEMQRITSDLSTDTEVAKSADLTPSGLARHSILTDYK